MKEYVILVLRRWSRRPAGQSFVVATIGLPWVVCYLLVGQLGPGEVGSAIGPAMLVVACMISGYSAILLGTISSEERRGNRGRLLEISGLRGHLLVSAWGCLGLILTGFGTAAGMAPIVAMASWAGQPLPPVVDVVAVFAGGFLGSALGLVSGLLLGRAASLVAGGASGLLVLFGPVLVASSSKVVASSGELLGPATAAGGVAVALLVLAAILWPRLAVVIWR